MQVIFGRKKHNCSSDLRTLPPNFAEQVLDLEAQLAIRCNLRGVRRLMELYSFAIELYAPSQDPKYLHYQERLHGLLSHAQVLSLLENQQTTERSNSLQIPAIPAKKISTERAAQKLLSTHQSNNTQLLKKVQADLHVQNSSLPARVQMRKTSFRSSFEDELEELVEKFVVKKQEIKSEISAKYAQQKVQVQELGNPGLVEKVVAQLEKRECAELEGEFQELEKQKKVQIEELRRNMVQRDDLCK